jgi:nucleoid-associated protein YgaU
MIPRGALVAGGFAVVAGGAVYLLRNQSPERTDAPDVDPRVRWVVDSGGPSGRAPDAGLAIPDPLQSVTATDSPFSARLASSTIEESALVPPARTSHRPTFISDPALSPRFAAPASAQFAASLRSDARTAPIAPLEDPARAVVAVQEATPATLELAPPALAKEEAESNRPVAIGRHLIQDGDTLEEIALSNYGDRSLAAFLFERNRRVLKYADLLPVGKEIVLYAPPENPPAGEAPAASSFVTAPVIPRSTLPGVAPPELAPLE